MSCMHTGKDTSSVTHYGCGQNYCVVASYSCGYERTDGSKNGCKDVATNTDEAWGPIKPKPDAAACVFSMIVLWEKQVQAPRFHVVQRGQSDNGTQFMGALFKYRCISISRNGRWPGKLPIYRISDQSDRKKLENKKNMKIRKPTK